MMPKQPTGGRAYVRCQRAAILATACIALIAATSPAPGSFSDGSRWNTVFSLIHHGTFAQDRQDAFSADVVFVNGHLYSHQPPLQPALIAAVGAVLQRGLGIVPGYYLLTLLTNGFAFLLMLVGAFRIIDMAVTDPRRRVLFSAAAAFASLGFVYSTVLTNHAPCAALLVFGAAYLPAPGRFSQALGGFLIGTAAAFELPFPGVFLALWSVRLLLVRRWLDFLLFTACAAPPIIFYLAFNYAVGGSLVPFAVRPELFEAVRPEMLELPFSPWSRTQLSGVGWHPRATLPAYAYHCLLGDRGLWLYSPLAVFGLLACFRPRRLPLLHALLNLSAFGGIAYYLLRTTNYGGDCFGIRWFVPAAISLYLGGLPWLEEHWHRPVVRLGFLFFLAFSVITVFLGVLTPFTPEQLSLKALLRRP